MAPGRQTPRQAAPFSKKLLQRQPDDLQPRAGDDYGSEAQRTVPTRCPDRKLGASSLRKQPNHGFRPLDRVSFSDKEAHHPSAE
jgi:hypothetical protein